VLLLAAGGLVARAVNLQLIDREFLISQGDARFVRDVSTTANRGSIVDRNGVTLAVSTPMDSAWANPSELALVPDQLPRSRQALKRDKNELARRITSNLDREFLYLARHMQPKGRCGASSARIPGVYLTREYRRYYPPARSPAMCSASPTSTMRARRARTRLRSLARRARTARSA
jgi:cell division protein FtsI (penicillin-binding protein 3)